MRVVAFDVEAETAHFRKPYAPLSPSTFSFPPPPTVLGLLGAILGYAKEEYHERLGWERTRIGVGLRRPARVVRQGLNLLNTKDGTDAYNRPRIASPRIQVPYEFLRDAAFRVWVGDAPDEVSRLLEERLREGTTVYTPTLGLANCLARLTFVEAGEATPRSEGDCCSVVPLSEEARVDMPPERLLQRLRVPARMNPERRVDRYQEVLVADDAQPLRAQNLELWALANDCFAFV